MIMMTFFIAYDLKYVF